MKENIAVVVCTTIALTCCMHTVCTFGKARGLGSIFFFCLIAPFMFHYSFHCCLYIIPALWPQASFRIFFWKDISWVITYATANENLVRFPKVMLHRVIPSSSNLYIVWLFLSVRKYAFYR